MFHNIISQPFGYSLSDAPPTTLYGYPRGRNIGRPILIYPNLVSGLDFDGVNDRAQTSFGPFAWVGDFSMMGWIVSDSIVGNRFIAGTTSAYAGDGIHVYQAASLRVVFRSGLDLIVSPFSVGARTHIGLSLSAGGIFIFYVNGVEVFRTTLTAASIPTVYGGHFFGGAGLGFYDGRQANWIFINRVVPSSEMLAYAQRTLTFPQNTQGLLGAYPMNQLGPLATQTPDISGNARHLDLINFVANPIAPF